MKAIIADKYHKLRTGLETDFPQVHKLLLMYGVYIKYLIAGGTAAAVDLSLLFLFTDVVGFHYLLSAVLAFMIAIVVSFNLQKHWTFRDTNQNVTSQMTVYVITGVINLGLNTLFMYFFVDIIGLMYLVAQVFSGAIVAIGSFLVYRFVIFKKAAGE